MTTFWQHRPLKTLHFLHRFIKNQIILYIFVFLANENNLNLLFETVSCHIVCPAHTKRQISSRKSNIIYFLSPGGKVLENPKLFNGQKRVEIFNFSPGVSLFLILWTHVVLSFCRGLLTFKHKYNLRENCFKKTQSSSNQTQGIPEISPTVIYFT